MYCLLCCIALFIIYKICDWLVHRPIIDGIPSKYVLITGCDTGFGNLLAQRLDRRGFQVIATCLTEEGQGNLRTQTSERLQTVHMDVTSDESIRRAFQEVKKMLPEDTGLWGLVNNAGVTAVGGPCDWHRREHYQKCFDVNVFGLVDVTIVFLPLIKKAQGRIVNVSSVVGRFAVSGAYSMSKFNVECFSDGLRVIMKKFNVAVSIIEPAFFDTNMVSNDNMISPMEKLWNQLTPEVQEEYGREFFDKLLSDTRKVRKLCSPKTFLVVDAMEHALTSVRPRTRYAVGWQAKWFLLPLSMLPSMICDPIHMRLMNLGTPKMMQRLT
ncbi:retinol dehydrogenase 7-like isoform X2 [Ptychodera flava]